MSSEDDVGMHGDSGVSAASTPFSAGMSPFGEFHFQSNLMAPSELPQVDPEYQRRVVRPPFTADNHELTGEMIELLQNDLQQITNRLNNLESRVLHITLSQVQPRSSCPSWWPFPDLSPQLLLLLVATHAVAFWFPRRSLN